ncbi:GTP-binding protein [Actinomyces wuliandei]|uniref:GTP-binding protein n=1 Tax=Actinomyces wuliandei TaxID=2057743 RepID=UPI001FA9FAF7|nr:GTP-binding protein [Actinomyces wuliandei]
MSHATHALVLVGAVDPTLLDLIDLVLSGEDAVVIRAQLLPHVGEDGLVRLTSTASLGEEPAVLDVVMPSSCQTCSLREVLVAVAEDRARQDPEGVTVVLLPAATELVHLVPRLSEELEGGRVRLAGVAHVLDAAAAVAELLEHRPLAEASVGALPDDARCTAEVHLANLGYADVVVALGQEESGEGADLVEHLRPHDTLLLPGLDVPVLDHLVGLAHDAQAAVSRIHPATTQAWGGPDDHGVWTLDLFATLPFHPGRLREMVADLAGRGLCARGCFWLPSRPGRVCAWEVAGGAVSVGDAGSWDEVPRGWGVPPVGWRGSQEVWVTRGGDAAVGPGRSGPQGGWCNASGDWSVVSEVRCGPWCHLVVTGLGAPEVRERVRQAFGKALLRREELSQAVSWVGVDDGLGDWLGPV